MLHTRVAPGCSRSPRRASRTGDVRRVFNARDGCSRGAGGGGCGSCGWGCCRCRGSSRAGGGGCSARDGRGGGGRGRRRRGCRFDPGRIPTPPTRRVPKTLRSVPVPISLRTAQSSSCLPPITQPVFPALPRDSGGGRRGPHVCANTLIPHILGARLQRQPLLKRGFLNCRRSAGRRERALATHA